MPQPKSASRARRAALLACVAAAVAAVGFAPSAGAAKKPKSVMKIAPGEVTVFKTGDAPDALPEDVQTAVMTSLTGYLNAATVTPLRKGKPADDAALGATLALPVVARLAGTDRQVLLDEGLPKSVSKITLRSMPVTLTGLADGGGNIVVVTANLAAKTTTKTTKGKLTITRTGELVFEPEGGAWKITGYSLVVDRAGKGVPPTAPAPTTPTPAAQ
jgi:hypothetical protein